MRDGLPESVAVAFASYVEAVFPGHSLATDDRGSVTAVAGVRPVQLQETRRAFYAGARFMLSAVFEEDFVALTDDQVEAAIRGWNGELQTFALEVGATATPEDDAAVAAAVYARPECPFVYCDAPDVCRPADACRHRSRSTGIAPRRSS